MKNQYVTSGRKKQKLQTRQKLLQTTTELLAKGHEFTLDDVAREAKISRATVYRYYSNVDLLSAEAVLDMQASTPELIYRGLKSVSVTDKILEVQNFYNSLTLDNEASFRKYLSIVVNNSVLEGVRGHRRVDTLQMVMEEPNISFSKEQATLLVNIASILMGMEPIIVAKDVCGLTNEETKKTLRWGLEMILKGMQLK